jgi:putative lipoic acid-binding regulatory protein
MSSPKDPVDPAAAAAAIPAMPEIPPEQSLIEYPSDFPIKVVGVMHDELTDTIVNMVIEHDPTFHAGKVETRPSTQGKYLSLTVTVRATSREQLDNLYRALSSHEMVKFVL